MKKEGMIKKRYDVSAVNNSLPNCIETVYKMKWRIC